MILDPNDDDSDAPELSSNAGEDVDVNLNHYRVPKLLDDYGPHDLNNPPRRRRNREQIKFSNEGKILTLTELAAQKVACHLPFGLVEHFDPPVPEPMQCRIAFWSFPQDEEDVRLYTCLANGKAEVFYRAEELVAQNAVCDILQVGFHLSANVQYVSETEDRQLFRVAITFDRRRITSCNCSCASSTFWCEHVVAVCLQRIRKPNEAKLRAPVSESLQRLEKNQLQKFAQYLINELPQQILPAAQRLLDELLSGDEAIINKNPAAPDPTAGATINENTSWCLDYTHLSLDIHKILLRQCTTQPTVCSDIQSLDTSAPPATTEYSQLLRPIRGREPEGIWNLISIVGEMMKRRDPNLFPLLDIMTEEVMKIDKIVTWWFETKVSLHSGSTIHFASGKSSQCTSQYSCSNFFDEIVHLWRLAALNPGASQSERNQLKEKFYDWHLNILERHITIVDLKPNGIKTNKRNYLELFPGFKSAMEGCYIEWDDWDDKRGKMISATNEEESNKPAKSSKRKKRRPRPSKHGHGKGTKSESADADQCSTTLSCSNSKTHDSDPDVSKNIDSDNVELTERNDCNHDEEIQDGEGNKENSSVVESAPQFHDDRNPADVANRNVREPLDEIQELEEQIILNVEGPAIEQELQVYFMDGRPESPSNPPPEESIEDYIKVNSKRLADKLETSYSKVEGLHAHGHLDEARKLARAVAQEILTQRNYPSLKQLYTLPRRRKKKGSLDNQMSIVASETLSKINFLCHVLIGEPENHCLVFRLVMFGIELKRSPAATKPLEVKLINQKQELISLLRNIALGEDQFNIIREKATALCEINLEITPEPLTTLIIGSYVFDALVLSRYSKSIDDANLGFQAALSALGVKIDISETDHPLLCEGIRRQRGELAFVLITHFKDDQEKLDMILKQLLDKDMVVDIQSSDKATKKNGPQIANQPTEASAHFMFEFAKTIYDKAGGNSNASHMFRPQLAAQNGGRNIHRKLHMCALRIALYALGIQNRTSTNWVQRTYSGLAFFIQEQALEIGLLAIKFLCENWEGYLTPVEAATVAGKAGCSNDLETKRIAAEMAKSCLKYASFLDQGAVTGILTQCQNQTIEMIEEACCEIEQMAENDNVCADVLFTTAQTWHRLYKKLITDETHITNGNLYQLNDMVVPEQQDIGASDWFAASGQIAHTEKCQQYNESVHPLMWDVYAQANFIPTSDTPIYKNIDYVRAAFRVGIRALDSLKLHAISKHNPKKLEDILWLLGISKSLGRECLYKFSKSVVKNIADPYILHIIIIEIIKFFEELKLPEDHVDRMSVLMPIYDKCLDRCLKQIRDLMKHISYDQKSCLETVLDIVQTLTNVTQTVTTAQCYWEILRFIDNKMDKRNRRSRININTNERRIWIKKFAMDLNVCACDDCWTTRGSNQRFRFKTLYHSN